MPEDDMPRVTRGEKSLDRARVRDAKDRPATKSRVDTPYKTKRPPSAALDPAGRSKARAVGGRKRSKKSRR